jgi:hypothetical protein
MIHLIHLIHSIGMLFQLYDPHEADLGENHNNKQVSREDSHRNQHHERRTGLPGYSVSGQPRLSPRSEAMRTDLP